MEFSLPRQIIPVNSKNESILFIVLLFFFLLASWCGSRCLWYFVGVCWWQTSSMPATVVAIRLECRFFQIFFLSSTFSVCTDYKYQFEKRKKVRPCGRQTIWQRKKKTAKGCKKGLAIFRTSINHTSIFGCMKTVDLNRFVYLGK